jgi:hypothetical protein
VGLLLREELQLCVQNNIETAFKCIMYQLNVSRFKDSGVPIAATQPNEVDNGFNNQRRAYTKVPKEAVYSKSMSSLSENSSNETRGNCSFNELPPEGI